jgi:hypothetical protein
MINVIVSMLTDQASKARLAKPLHYFASYLATVSHI